MVALPYGLTDFQTHPRYIEHPHAATSDAIDSRLRSPSQTRLPRLVWLACSPSWSPVCLAGHGPDLHDPCAGTAQSIGQSLYPSHAWERSQAWDRSGAYQD